MDRSKLKKTIIVSLCVALGSQIHFQFLSNGFIVALSVLIMEVFIYCYEDLKPMYIAFMTAIFAPLMRVVVLAVQGTLFMALKLTLPDVAFFMTYGIVYTFFYRFVNQEPKTMRNFPYTIFIADISGNIGELTARTFLWHQMMLTPGTIAALMVIAAVRTGLVMMVVVAIESYTHFMIKREHRDEFHRLLLQASMIEGEMRVMEKNEKEVEEVMKQAYSLYRELEQRAEGSGTGSEADRETARRVLAIAKNTHEIKADYQNVLSVLQETFMGRMDDQTLSMDEIISLERSNVAVRARERGQDLTFYYSRNASYQVKQTFKMMSIVRNLLTNAAEAMGDRRGHIRIETWDDRDSVYLSVWDDGPGIEEEDLDTIFLEGYSTKFDEKTGNIMRGLGLSLVRDFVENDYGGRITVRSTPGEFTEFRIAIPRERIAAGDAA